MHTITKVRTRYGGVSFLRAVCSCGAFKSDVPRLSIPRRRAQDRLIAEHLRSAADEPQAVAALLQAFSIEAPL